MNQEIPNEFKDKSREELYMDIIMLSNYVNKLKNEVLDLKANISLHKGEAIKNRTDNFVLKSEIGHQNIKIQQLNEEKDNIIDIDFNIKDYE